MNKLHCERRLSFHNIASHRLLFITLILVFTLPLLASCVVATPTSTSSTSNSPRPGTDGRIQRSPDSYPAIPFEDPNILGRPRGDIAFSVFETDDAADAATVEPIDKLADLDAALACLDEGQFVYGITRANTNVRAEPSADACRMGRAPRGRLIRIDSVFEQNERLPLASVSGSSVFGASAAAETVPVDEMIFGFEEDVLPIFERSCSACHNAIAQQGGLQVNDYAALLAGSTNGVVLVPGNADASWLWDQIRVGTMPLNGELPDNEKELIKRWIDDGARRNRPSVPVLVPTPESQPRTASSSAAGDLWLQISSSDVDSVPNRCEQQIASPQNLVSNQLVEFLTCGAAPNDAQLALLRDEIVPVAAPVAAAAPVQPVSAPAPAAAPAPVAAAPAPQPVAYGEGVSVSALGLSAPSDSDPFFIPRGGFCIGQKQTRLQDNRSITAMSFAPDGRLFLALDTIPVGDKVDQIILTDAYHPSRAIGVFDSNSDSGFNEIMNESPRITGLAYHQGALYVSRSGEIGQIPDGGQYKKLAGGFAVEGRLWHANNGLAIHGGNLYVATGGIRDGWSDGPIEGIGEAGAQNVVSGGNPYASRLVRAPLAQLLSSRSIDSFQTAARGFRNPYGLAAAPDGRLWVTDNGATNVPEDISAGDEVNVFNPQQTPPGTPESSTPYYGFPLALTGANAGWKTPVIDMPNSAAPTGITWAYNTVFYAQYGRDPGLYRLGRDGSGRTIGERVMMGWPIVAVATAPDGALWIGTATGRLYRMTTGC